VEGPQAVKTPPKRKTRVQYFANLIQREVSFFNGWYVSERAEREACEAAARKIVRYLNKGRKP